MKPKPPPAPPPAPTHIGDRVTAAIVSGVRADILDDIGDARRVLQRALAKAERADAPPEVIDAIRAAWRAADVHLPIGTLTAEGWRWR